MCSYYKFTLKYSLYSPPNSPHTQEKDFLIRSNYSSYTGKGFQWSSSRSLCKNHPRIRGERAGSWLRDHLQTGSPPHSRGKGQKRRVPADRTGITPAYAGKGLHVPLKACHCWDHPRIRGERCATHPPLVVNPGSPRIRGERSILTDALTPY